MKTDKIIRNLSNELGELGFDKEQVSKILEWVDTIPVRNYGDENLKVEVKKGVVRIEEHLIDSDDLSFNNLPKDKALQYLWDNGKMFNPFEIPDDVKMFNPFTYKAINRKGEEINMGNETQLLRNPFSFKISTKIEFKDGVPYKKWNVNENNEWVEAPLFDENKND